MGSIAEINKRRTKMPGTDKVDGERVRVSVVVESKDDTYGVTIGWGLCKSSALFT